MAKINNDVVSNINTMLDKALSDAGGEPKSRNDARQWVKQKSKLQNRKELLNLVNQGPVKKELDNMLGPFIEPTSCQIAFRFPGENLDDGGIHIDNFTEKDFKRHSLPEEFDALVGICLSDTKQIDSGNFTVFPGSHYRVQAWSNDNGGYYYFKENGLRKMIKSFESGAELKPYQLCVSSGDIIIANRFMLHLISAPNKSLVTRKIIWFRINSSDMYGDPFSRIWDKWKFIENYKFKDLDDKSDDIELIEKDGYGYLSSQDPYEIKVKSKFSVPNIFASMLSIRYDTNGNVSIKTNGFLSSIGHDLLLSQIKNKFNTKIKNCSKYKVCKYLYQICDYSKLIVEWFPFDNTKLTSVIETRGYIADHIKSESKTGMMKQWADEMNITGFVVRGYPGYVVVIGDSYALNIFDDRLYCQYWKKGMKVCDDYPDEHITDKFIVVNNL